MLKIVKVTTIIYIKMANIVDAKKVYAQKNIITFGINISQSLHKKENIYKKKIIPPKEWQNVSIDNKLFKNNNGLAMLTGKTNNIFVIDIDNIDDWKYLLTELNEEEPNTVKAISGSGGIHLYFKYDEKLTNIKSTSKSVTHNGRKLAIDVRTDGGMIIVDPTTYYDNNTKKELRYIWTKSIIDNELMKLPDWLLNLFMKENDKLIDLDKITNIPKVKNKIKSDKTDAETTLITMNEQTNMYINNDMLVPNTNDCSYTKNEINELLWLLNKERVNNYDEWKNVGMCLKIINSNYCDLWDEWSQQSDKYEFGECERKWKTFRNNSGFYFGSLINWVKHDNIEMFNNFQKKTEISNVINNYKTNFPDNKLQIDKIIINEDYHYISLLDKFCPIYKMEHENNLGRNLFLEMTPDELVMKCHKCIGRKFPCNHLSLNKTDAKIIFNVNIENVNITNNYNTSSEDINNIEIDENLKIFDDLELNNLILISLNGTQYDIGKVIYYLQKDNYNYGINKKWYEFKDHRWQEDITLKNFSLRGFISNGLVTLYNKVTIYYRNNKDVINSDKKQEKIRNIIKTLKTSSVKNSIMTELEEIFITHNDKKFVDKLDRNQYLLGFNNGIYDLQKFEFRDGKQSDYISLTTGYDYKHNNSENYNDMMKFLEDVLPIKDDFTYLMTYLSIGLIGNLLELFTIFSGNGRNGKSKLIELIKLTFGEYFVAVESQMFTRQ